MDRSDSRLLVIVDAPDIYPEAHAQSCEKVSQFVPSTSVARGAACSGYVSHLDEVRDRFPEVSWCECLEDVALHKIPHTDRDGETFLEGMEYVETLTSGETPVDVHYQYEEENFVFSIDGRIGARLSFDAIRDEEARPEIFSERAARAVNAIRWADQDWRNRKPRQTS